MLSRSRLSVNRLKRRSHTRSNRRLSLSPGKKNSLVVAIRVRPENDSERASSRPKILQVIDNDLLIFDPVEEEDYFFFQGVKQSGRDLNKRPNKNLPFNFNYVFDGNATNEDVFNSTTKPIIDGLLNGINCSVFAYGATGSGKTYTMLGTPENPGIIFLMVMALFEKIKQLQDKICDLSISYLEVYNETIKDLLTPSPPLMIREDSRGLIVSGLSHFKPDDADHLMRLLHFGNKNRTQHPTDANSESSRSHAVFQVYIKLKDKVSGLSANVRMAKMSLIDLAGSERATVVSNREKARLREGANINQSLLALGSCINALADRKTKGQHIPYRNSKLTRILKDSLGGNCFTVMIAAVSPSLPTYEDTYNTLKYADRAKGIQLTLKRNVVNVDAHITKYVKIVEAHQKEIEELKYKLKLYEESHLGLIAPVPKCSVGTMTVATVPVLVVAEPESCGLTSSSVDSLCLVHNEHRALQRKYLDCESAIRLLKVKKAWKQDIQKIHVFLTAKDKGNTNLESLTKTMDNKEARLSNEKVELSILLNKSRQKLGEATQNIGSVPLEILENQNLLSEISDVSRWLRHALEIGSLKSKHEETNRSVLESLAKIVKRQQDILEGHGFLTADLIADLESIVEKIHGVKEVNWADQANPQNHSYSSVAEAYNLLPHPCNQKGNLEVTPLATFYNPKPKLTTTAFHGTYSSINSSKQMPCSGDFPEGYRDDSGWLSNPSHSKMRSPPPDSVRRSLDETFAVMEVVSPIPESTNVLNRTFSPVVEQQSTPENPVSSTMNRTFTPIHEKPSSTDQLAAGSHADILKSPVPMHQNQPDSSSSVHVSLPPFNNVPLVLVQAVQEAEASGTVALETPHQQRKPYRQKSSSSLTKAANEMRKLTERIRAQKNAGGHRAGHQPLGVMQVTSTQDRIGQKTAQNKTSSSWAKSFTSNLKSKENQVPSLPQGLMRRQVSFLPRPGLQNKQQPLHRVRSTPQLNNFKS